MPLPIVPYLGIKTVKIRTYTTGYVPDRAPWSFCPNALQPMESNVYTLNGLPIAANGSVFDLVKGISTFTLGNKAVADHVFSQLIWVEGKLVGWCFKGQTDTVGFLADYTMPLGVSISADQFNFVEALSLNPAIPNTQTPAPGASFNWIFREGLYNSYFTNLNMSYAAWNGNASYSITTGPMFNGGGNRFNTSTQNFVCGLTWNGLDYIWMSTNLNPVVPRLIVGILGDIMNAQTYLPIWGSAGGLDVNPIINSDTNGIGITYQGFLIIKSDTVTVEGNTLNGYGILIKPDFSGFQILQFIPTDAISATWNTVVGTYTGKFDTHGALWFKNVNVDGTIFISAGSVAKLLPVFPPIALPMPPADFETTILPYRGKDK